MLAKPINAEIKLRELFAGAVVAMRAEIDSKPYSFGSPLRASGKSSALLDFRITETTAEIIGAGYTFQMKYGRKAGKAPPSDVILQWLIDKQIPTPEKLSQKTFAFLIARKIGRSGTYVYRTGGIPLFETILNQEFIDRIAAVVIEIVGETIVPTFKQILK
jgi:hypothetical protein